MPKLGVFLALFSFALAACGGGSGGSSPPSPTSAPTATVTPTATITATATITPTPTPDPPPTPATALSVTYTTSYQPAQATPYPGSAPIQLFGQGQSAVLNVTGGTTPYAGQLLYCTSGQGFGSPFTFVQNASLTSFTLTATQYAGSCTVYIADSSNPNKSVQLQATLTTTSGTVQ